MFIIISISINFYKKEAMDNKKKDSKQENDE